MQPQSERAEIFETQHKDCPELDTSTRPDQTPDSWGNLSNLPSGHSSSGTGDGKHEVQSLTSSESIGKEITENIKILPKNRTFSEHNNSVVGLQDNGSDKGESNDGANASTEQRTDQTSIYTAQESKKRDDEKVLCEDHDVSESVVHDNGSDEGESSDGANGSTGSRTDLSSVHTAQEMKKKDEEKPLSEAHDASESEIQDNRRDETESNGWAKAQTDETTNESVHTAQEDERKKKDDGKVISEDHDATEKVIAVMETSAKNQCVIINNEDEQWQCKEISLRERKVVNEMTELLMFLMKYVSVINNVMDFDRKKTEVDSQKSDKAKKDLLHEILNSSVHMFIPKHIFHVYMESEPRSETVRQDSSNSLEETRPVMVERYPWTMMNDEKFRLCTFRKYPRSAPISTILLARDGFVYTGSGSDDKVICFFCEVRHQNWNSHDNVRVVHAQLSPACPIVLEKDCGNIRISNNPLVQVVQASSATPIVPSGARRPPLDLEAESTRRGPQHVSRLEGTMSPSENLRVRRRIARPRNDDQSEIVLNHAPPPFMANNTARLEEDPAVRAVVAVGFDSRRVVRAARTIINEARTLNGETLLAEVTGTELTAVETTPEEAAMLERMRYEIQALRQTFVCKICLQRRAFILFLPCGHLVTCYRCRMAPENCPICRASIQYRWPILFQ